jgi:hypothetical protein
MGRAIRSAFIRAGITLGVAAFCVAASPPRSIADPADHSSQQPPQSADPGSCPAKSANDAGIVGITLMFSVSKPDQDVLCKYSDGSSISFHVDRGCDVQPTDVIADGMSAGATGFTFGRHECRESSPGAGKCRIACPRR